MLGDIIRLLLAAAVGLFVLSLPLSKTDTGATLRRLAGLCFALAFLPSIICGLFFAPTGAPDAQSAGNPAPSSTFFTSLGCVAAVVVASFIAYGLLKLRSRFTAKAKPRDPWEALFNRGGGKRPFAMHPRASRTRGPFAFDDGEDD